MIQQELKSLVHLRRRQNKCFCVRNRIIFAIFQKCKFTHPCTFMLRTAMQVPCTHSRLYLQMLNVNKQQKGKPLENGVNGTVIGRKCSLTYSNIEYYLTWNTVVISLHILDHK